jgi:transglutaminase-like putative cysteine protease
VRRELLLGALSGVVVAGSLVGMARVFSEPGWLGPSLVTLVLSLVVAAGARRVGFGPVASLVGSLAGLAVLTYVMHLPAGPLIPGAEQLADARELLGDGLQQLRREPAPTTPLPGLMLIVTTGVWLVTHATHELVVRRRRPVLALLPPTVLWAVPLAMPQAAGPTVRHTVPFLACAGLLLLLDADAEIASWARDRGRTRLSTAGLAVGGIALALAAALPGALPGYGQPAWVDLFDGGGTTGYQPIVDVGDRLKLPDPRPVLQVRSPRRVYLRIAALDTFDSATWRVGPPGSTSFTPEESQLFSTERDLPFETPVQESERVTVSVEVLDLENIYVPVPYQPVSVGGPDRDQMIYSLVGGFLATGELAPYELGGQLVNGVVPGFSYRIVADIPDPSPEQLRAVEFRASEVGPWTLLPGDDVGSDRYDAYAELAEQVYADAGAGTVLDRTLALQSFFTGPEFRYSTTEVDRLLGPGGLEDFVFESRVGYCEYFATAMAVMLRSTGIPARVAVGFLPGERVAAADPLRGEPATFEVSSSDAHAWVEVLFPGYGWIKFDPTPRADAATMPPSGAEIDPLDTLAEQRDRDQVDLGDEQPSEAADPQDVTDRLPPGVAADTEPTGIAPIDEGGAPVPLLVLAVLLTLGGAGLAVSSWRLRRHHPELGGADRVLAAQRRLLAGARQLGLGRLPSETSVEVTARWAQEGRVPPDTAAAFARLAQVAAFAGRDGDDDGERAELLVDELLASLRASVARVDRWRAPVRVPAELAVGAGRDLLARGRALLRDDRD